MGCNTNENSDFKNNQEFITKTILEINKSQGASYSFIAIYVGKNPFERYSSFLEDETDPEARVC
jgi:hypothetical protein